jgi:hypothetical protein
MLPVWGVHGVVGADRQDATWAVERQNRVPDARQAERRTFLPGSLAKLRLKPSRPARTRLRFARSSVGFAPLRGADISKAQRENLLIRHDDALWKMSSEAAPQTDEHVWSGSASLDTVSLARALRGRDVLKGVIKT